MTGYGLTASLAWSAVAGYAVWRAAGLLNDYRITVVRIANYRRLMGRERLASRERLALLNATPAQKAQAETIALSKIELPDDLEAVASQESEPWAVDDQRAMMREKYALLKDWNKVRRAVGVGEMP